MKCNACRYTLAELGGLRIIMRANDRGEYALLKNVELPLLADDGHNRACSSDSLMSLSSNGNFVITVPADLGLGAGPSAAGPDSFSLLHAGAGAGAGDRVGADAGADAEHAEASAGKGSAAMVDIESRRQVRANAKTISKTRKNSAHPPPGASPPRDEEE